MKLFERDYTQLTDSEHAEWQALRDEEVVDKFGKFEIRQNLFPDYPKAVRHFISLFPNQYLDIVELKDETRLRPLLNDFRTLLDDSNVNEREILNFINGKRAYFIVASILNKYYRFGHHDAFLFSEFPLGTSYKVDYVLVGRSSDGWSFVFVEFESPNQNITLAGGELGLSFRKGLHQISDWDTWLDANFSSLRETFEKCRGPIEPLPSEFVSLDKSRIHYVVVAGRRDDFLGKTYSTRRKKLRDNSEFLLHYDNIVDAAQDTIGRNTY